MATKLSRFAWIAVIAALLATGLQIVLCMRGCAGRPASPGYERTKDPAYGQELKDVMKARKPLVKARSETVSEMEAVIAKARAALPQGATDEEVKAELDGNPEKYPEWKGLNEKIAKDNAAIEDSLKDAQSRVRARILKELGPRAKPKPASAGVNQILAQRKVMNIPTCAAAPRMKLFGLAMSGPKSVIAPTPMKIRQG